MGGCVGQQKKPPKEAVPQVTAKPSAEDLQKKRLAEEEQKKRQQQQRMAKAKAQQEQRQRQLEREKEMARKSVQNDFNRYQNVDNDYDALSKKRVGMGFNHATKIY